MTVRRALVPGSADRTLDVGLHQQLHYGLRHGGGTDTRLSTERPTETEQFSPANRRRLSAPGVRSFIAIADRWDLDETARRKVLGFPTSATYQAGTWTARGHGELTLDVAR